MKQKYDFSEKGVNAAIAGYIKDHWNDLEFNGIGDKPLVGLEEVTVFVKNGFIGEGIYKFNGDARPMLSDDMGNYSVDTHNINGEASIQIKDNEPYVIQIGNVSMKKK